MVEFFIPGLKKDIDLIDHWYLVKGQKEKITGWELTDRKIYSMKYTHNNRKYFVEVGKGYKCGNDPISIIFESVDSNGYLIYPFRRGIMSDNPIVVSKTDVDAIEDFD